MRASVPNVATINSSGTVPGGTYRTVEFVFDDPTFIGTVDGQTVDPSVWATLGPFEAAPGSKLDPIVYTRTAGTFKLITTT